MKICSDWIDYELIASGNGEKLERYGDIVLLRPDPQAIWAPPYNLNTYNGINALYNRSSSGGGFWDIRKKFPEKFRITWRDLNFELKLMGFKHVGIFPEQAVNWDRMTDVIVNAGREINILNLFGYTGGATVACVRAGARVCHVDAAKSMCEMAKNNIKINELDATKTRFIVDDCIKFVEREIRRGKKYDAIIMDPPSYGRGPKGEMWRLEDGIFDLVKLTKGVLSDSPLFYLINSYTTGLQPTVMKNIIDIVFKNIPHEVDADEIGIMGSDKIVLPCGCSAFCSFKN